MNWYDQLNKSQLTPPDSWFGIVWPLLYTLMAISLGIVLFKGDNRRAIIWAVFIFGAQLFFNLMWTPTFFKNKDISMSVLIILITLALAIYTALLFYKINVVAGYLLIPYILWLFLASYLNMYIFIKN